MHNPFYCPLFAVDLLITNSISPASRISNGRMEGSNNKIKTLRRHTYGLRDKRDFTLRLYSRQDSKLALLG